MTWKSIRRKPFNQSKIKVKEELVVHLLVQLFVLFPSRFDNYGADHSHSRLLCLSGSQFPIKILIRDTCEINEFVVVNPSIDEYYFNSFSNQ